MGWENIVCRVCGREFDADRVDATTCSGTRRQRLRRGGEFAYFAKLTKAQQEKERERHAGYDEQLRDHAALRRERLALREENREARRERKPRAESLDRLKRDLGMI